MSEVIDWGWISRTLRQVQAEQAALRGMVEPLPARFTALEARFTALESRVGGIEQSVNAIGLTLRELAATSAEIADFVRGRDAPTA